jgi:cbb3-type cytochrome oxidase subunit 3
VKEHLDYNALAISGTINLGLANFLHENPAIANMLILLFTIAVQYSIAYLKSKKEALDKAQTQVAIATTNQESK